MPKSCPTYTPEFRHQVVALARARRSTGDLTREFGPSGQTIRNWVAQADRDEGLRADGLTREERNQFKKLRRELKRVQEERDILAKAAAWFAQESILKKSSGS